MILDQLLPDEVLALTIYGEARGESIEGQVAIANIIMNRFLSNTFKYKNNVGNVCLEKFQFSCWNDNDPNRAKLLSLANSLVIGDIKDTILRQCLAVARNIVGNHFVDNISGNKNYMTNNLFNSNKKPSWAINAKNIKVIGNHTFFNV